MSYFYNKNLKLHYDVLGSGKPLVLIAGITCDNNHWSLMKSELSKSFQLIMPDNRGVGKSDTPECNYTVADMAADIVALLDNLNLDKVSILGHSMGGAIAQYLACYYPERVEKLIISHSFIKFRASSIMFCQHEYLLAELNASPEIRATAILPFIYSDDFIGNGANVQALINAIATTKSKQSLDSYKQQIYAISEFNSMDYIQKIKAETLVIAGEFDKLAPFQDSQEIVNKLDNAKLKIMAGAHVPMWETPEQYANLITAFLSRSVVVVEQHISQYPNPIIVNAGDVVITGREDSEWIGWVFCTNIQSNVSGWVPQQIISVLTVERGIILEDYSAVELNVLPEQQVSIERELNGWAWCCDGEQRGWLPLEKLKIAKD
ncbi:MAG TPA: hypothetical protein DHV02_05270 [Neisseriales bacterium]|jgi:pimeloyl-ACP methyl ester carboxylesterase|nr:hypothetical protein [Neisseriales bacterium]